MQVNYWSVVPAAGVGRRMGNAIPKQYLPLAGRMVIEHTLDKLTVHPRIQAVYVALSENDGWWRKTAFSGHPDVVRVAGGKERCHSVLNALRVLMSRADPEDWVLVHDAARPCLRPRDLELLIDSLTEHPVGGLLGIPVRDTMKRADRQAQVCETLQRDGLWHAYTPQMFRLQPLFDALSEALSNNQLVTDEASAMELAGFRPLMVEGHSDNLKITRPEDLPLASFHLAWQEQEHANRPRL